MLVVVSGMIVACVVVLGIADGGSNGSFDGFSAQRIAFQNCLLARPLVVISLVVVRYCSVVREYGGYAAGNPQGSASTTSVIANELSGSILLDGPN
jgi:hypothetical protein